MMKFYPHSCQRIYGRKWSELVTRESLWSEHPCGLLEKLAIVVCEKYRSHVLEAVNSTVKNWRHS